MYKNIKKKNVNIYSYSIVYFPYQKKKTFMLISLRKKIVDKFSNQAVKMNNNKKKLGFQQC